VTDLVELRFVGTARFRIEVRYTRCRICAEIQGPPVDLGHLVVIRIAVVDCRSRCTHFAENRQCNIVRIRLVRRKRRRTGFVAVETGFGLGSLRMDFE
jgi:hypothetical protein